MSKPPPDSSGRRRADVSLVERGFFPSRARAQEAIEAGLVTADGARVRKPSDMIRHDAALEARAAHPYVSRGGVKLAAALAAFAIDPRGGVCLDVGSSTGGFTDVLLRHGAKRVYAVDVGTGQLHPTLAADPRVVSLERTDARNLSAALVPEPVDCLVADVSFISLKLVLPGAVALAEAGAVPSPCSSSLSSRPGRPMCARASSATKRSTLPSAATSKPSSPLSVSRISSLIPSPIAGGDGNREFLLGARRG